MQQGFANAGHVAVPENPEHTGEERMLPSITADVLRGEEPEESLSDGEPGSCSHTKIRRANAESSRSPEQRAKARPPSAAGLVTKLPRAQDNSDQFSIFGRSFVTLTACFA